MNFLIRSCKSNKRNFGYPNEGLDKSREVATPRLASSRNSCNCDKFPSRSQVWILETHFWGVLVALLFVLNLDHVIDSESSLIFHLGHTKASNMFGHNPKQLLLLVVSLVLCTSFLEHVTPMLHMFPAYAMANRPNIRKIL